MQREHIHGLRGAVDIDAHLIRNRSIPPKDASASSVAVVPSVPSCWRPIDRLRKAAVASRLPGPVESLHAVSDGNASTTVVFGFTKFVLYLGFM